jgi:hypothetical protein
MQGARRHHDQVAFAQVPGDWLDKELTESATTPLEEDRRRIETLRRAATAGEAT